MFEFMLKHLNGQVGRYFMTNIFKLLKVNFWKVLTKLTSRFRLFLRLKKKTFKATLTG